MRHAIYGSSASEASVAILVKDAAFDTDKIKKAYIDDLGANPKAFIAYSLWYNSANKCPAAEAKMHLEQVLHSIKQLGIKKILLADSKYFKYLTKEVKPASKFLGYKCTSQIEGYENEFDIFYVPNYQAAKHNVRTADDIAIGLQFFQRFLSDNYVKPGQNVINSAQYPKTLHEINKKLNWLLTQPELTVDIETRGLKFHNCGIASIAFAWDKHNFVSIPVDRGFFQVGVEKVLELPFEQYVKDMLWKFFHHYRGKLIAHNAGFDFKVLVYELWMENLQDYKGMIDGIQCLTRSFDDTKVIAYLATNNAVENALGLKDLSKEYMGTYAEDVVDTDKIELDDLLLYNGRDCLATWFVYEKYYPKMVADAQENLYHSLFKPSIITLLQTELVGMPILPDKVQLAKRTLEELKADYVKVLDTSALMKEFMLTVKQEKCKEFTEAAKKKVFTMDDPRITRITFNPNSNQQVGKLLYEYMGLPVIDLTDTKQPAVGGKTLKKLLNHTDNVMYIAIIQALYDLSKVEKILTSFIPAFEAAVQQPDGTWRLYGNFNLGGTVSGRLSSSDPNLQNLPSGSTFGKLIKACFGGRNGWLFGGADFNSLEDMVSALTTRDPNKLKVYTDGYDGHCIRAFSYFGDQMPDIQAEVAKHGETPAIINSIKKKYDALRSLSKTPTFALTYQGTFHTLMNNLGLEKDVAMAIETNYHELYKVSDEWVAERIQNACEDGYVTGAFGLKLRTPTLKLNGRGKLHYKAAAEGRTAGNMLGQSYGMLNSRAANELRERIWDSPYRYDIMLVGQIHDAIYLLWRNTLGITKWVNDNIIACMEWDGLVELQHPIVKVGAELDIFYPNWAEATTLANGMSKEAIYDLCKPKPEAA